MIKLRNISCKTMMKYLDLHRAFVLAFALCLLGVRIGYASEQPTAEQASSELPVSEVPEGLSIIGLSKGSWNLYLENSGHLTPVENIDSPRTAAYHQSAQKIAYVGVDGLLRINDLNSGATKELKSASGSSRFTQPAFSPDGSWLYVVELPEGKSRRTNIVGFDLSAVSDEDSQHGIVRKRTAQFEPNIGDDNFLYYTTAICVDDCEGMIWELWRRSLVDATQKQLTLMNALATQPHLGHDGLLYFSSNASGKFQIWRMQPEVGAKAHKLTSAGFRDSEPVTSSNGDLFFIRKSREGTALMRFSDSTLSKVDTPGLEDLRNLGISQ